jgi:1-acyl-sn-glycerol-3-phosphate acyltransferase
MAAPTPTPSLARVIASLALPAAELERLAALHFRDAGHGFDAFGLSPDHVALGESVVLPLYQRYFRVRSVGAHHIPRSGPAVLAANHSGNVPVDGMLIWTDVLRQTNPPRVVRPIADHFVPALPFIGTFFARGGMVGGSRGNAQTLLEAGELLLIFPEGTPGILKPFRERYQLRRFREGHAEMAIRHGAPIIPVGVVGGEEQLPALFLSKRLGKPFGVPAVPIPAVPLPLPVRYHLYYGDPIPVHERYRPDEADDPAVVRAVCAEVQAAVHALIQRGLRERPGVFS